MKRLLILTLLLMPFGLTTINQFVETSKRGVPVGPRVSRVSLEAGPDLHGSGREKLAAAVVNQYPMATEEGANEAAYEAVEERLARKLADHGISETWRAPRALVDEMVREGQLERIEKDYGDVFLRTLILDESEAQIRRLVEAHEREVAGRRLVKLGGLLSFVLICLATMSAYIRADEATKGYYTRSLQAASLVAVGVAGSAVYFWLG